MSDSTRRTVPVIVAVLAVISSWVWVPAVAAAALGDWTRPWFSPTWFAVTVLASVVAFVRHRDEVLAWARAPFRG